MLFSKEDLVNMDHATLVGICEILVDSLKESEDLNNKQLDVIHELTKLGYVPAISCGDDKELFSMLSEDEAAKVKAIMKSDTHLGLAIKFKDLTNRWSEVFGFVGL